MAPSVEATALQYSNEPTTSVTKSLNVITPTFEVERTVDQQHHSQKLQQMFVVLSLYSNTGPETSSPFVDCVIDNGLP